jgi:hypothetical protein
MVGTQVAHVRTSRKNPQSTRTYASNAMRVGDPLGVTRGPLPIGKAPMPRCQPPNAFSASRMRRGQLRMACYWPWWCWLPSVAGRNFGRWPRNCDRYDGATFAAAFSRSVTAATCKNHRHAGSRVPHYVLVGTKHFSRPAPIKTWLVRLGIARCGLAHCGAPWWMAPQCGVRFSGAATHRLRRGTCLRAKCLSSQRCPVPSRLPGGQRRSVPPRARTRRTDRHRGGCG